MQGNVFQGNSSYAVTNKGPSTSCGKLFSSKNTMNDKTRDYWGLRGWSTSQRSWLPRCSPSLLSLVTVIRPCLEENTKFIKKWPNKTTTILHKQIKSLLIWRYAAVYTSVFYLLVQINWLTSSEGLVIKTSIWDRIKQGCLHRNVLSPVKESFLEPEENKSRD